MKFMKRMWIVLAVLLLCLAGCGQQDEWEKSLKVAESMSGITDDSQLRVSTEQMLDALIADDAQSAYGALYEGADYNHFLEIYAQLRQALPQLTTYQLTPSGINKTVTNGVATVSVRYMMSAGEQRYFVDATRAEGYDGLIAFYVNEYIPVIVNGTLSNMEGATTVQWVMLLVGMAEIAFVLWAFVDCCRHKLRRKWLWLLLIALGYVVAQAEVTPEQFRTGVRIGAFLSYTCLMNYSIGGFVLRIILPAGAIIYVALRKRLFANYVKFQQEKLLKSRETETEPEDALPVAETTDAANVENES